MPVLCLPPLAATAVFPWLNLVWVLAGIAVFLCLLAALGRYLAATHPEPAPLTVESATPMACIPADTAAVIAAAVYATLGGTARVMAVVPREHLKVNVDNLMLQWSLEGRREIYSSHRVR